MVTLRLAQPAQLRGVVDLAVEDHDDCAVLARHGLLAGRRQVHDAEPRMGELPGSRTLGPRLMAPSVRTAVGERVERPLYCKRCRRGPRPPRYPAHVDVPEGGVAGRRTVAIDKPDTARRM